MPDSKGKTLLLLKPRGFCAGVVRAIDIVRIALDAFGPPIYVRKEIVHNSYVVEELKGKGAIFVDEVCEVPDGQRLIYSAHGVSPTVREASKLRNLQVVDATCPLVTKVHVEAVKYAKGGYSIILIGHHDHDEVIGTLGEAPDVTQVVGTPQEVEHLEVPDPTRVAYITQTTLSVDDTKAVIAALRGRFSNLVGPETRDICYATQNRQTAVRELAKLVDVIIVVGARNSSNSNRLREIGEEVGVPSYLVADGSEVRSEWLDGKRVVGLTAGASAPDVLVDDVVAALRRYTPIQISTLPGIEEKIQFRLPSPLLEAAVE